MKLFRFIVTIKMEYAKTSHNFPLHHQGACLIIYEQCSYSRDSTPFVRAAAVCMVQRKSVPMCFGDSPGWFPLPWSLWGRAAFPGTLPPPVDQRDNSSMLMCAHSCALRRPNERIKPIHENTVKCQTETQCSLMKLWSQPVWMCHILISVKLKWHINWSLRSLAYHFLIILPDLFALSPHIPLPLFSWKKTPRCDITAVLPASQAERCIPVDRKSRCNSGSNPIRLQLPPHWPKNWEPEWPPGLHRYQTRPAGKRNRCLCRIYNGCCRSTVRLWSQRSILLWWSSFQSR